MCPGGLPFLQLLEDWLYSGQPKVVVKAPDEKALMEIMDIARAAHVRW